MQSHNHHISRSLFSPSKSTVPPFFFIPRYNTVMYYPCGYPFLALLLIPFFCSFWKEKEKRRIDNSTVNVCQIQCDATLELVSNSSSVRLLFWFWLLTAIKKKKNAACTAQSYFFSFFSKYPPPSFLLPSRRLTKRKKERRKEGKKRGAPFEKEKEKKHA